MSDHQQPDPDKYVRVLVLRPFYARGRLRKPGTSIDLPESKARFRVEAGDALVPSPSALDALAADPYQFQWERGYPIATALQRLYPDDFAELVQDGAKALRVFGERSDSASAARARAAERHHLLLAAGMCLDLASLLKAGGDDRYEVYATTLPAGAGPDVAAVRIERQRWGRDLHFKAGAEDIIRAHIHSREIAVEGMEGFRDIRIHRVRRAAAPKADADPRTNVVAFPARGHETPAPIAVHGDTSSPAPVDDGAPRGPKRGPRSTGKDMIEVLIGLIKDGKVTKGMAHETLYRAVRDAMPRAKTERGRSFKTFIRHAKSIIIAWRAGRPIDGQ